MMDRIEISYQKQKEFTAHASHELRTPLSRITSQLENRIYAERTSENKTFLSNILKDVNQVTELIHSLLILSKLDSSAIASQEIYRMDEIIFTVIEKITQTFPDFTILFDIEESDNLDALLEISGNDKLLEIAINNILKNAYFYSDNKQAKITISSENDQLLITFTNSGTTLDAKEQQNLFQPFMRGKNTNKVTGFGLGLRIVQRVLFMHKANLHYSASENLNSFQIIFEKRENTNI